METIYDWVTVAIFAGLIVLFLQRSTSTESAQDEIWHYLPPSVACAACNYFGNEGQHVIAIALIAAIAAYTIMVLKPFAAHGR